MYSQHEVTQISTFPEWKGPQHLWGSCPLFMNTCPLILPTAGSFPRHCNEIHSSERPSHIIVGQCSSIVSLQIVISLNELWGQPGPFVVKYPQGLAHSGQAFNKALSSTKGCSHSRKEHFHAFYQEGRAAVLKFRPCVSICPHHVHSL